MNCELWQDKIDAFVDSELASDETRQFEEHLRSCPACSAETLARQRLKFETHLAGRRYEPQPAFEAAMRRRLEAKPARARFSFIPAFAGALALLALAIFAGVTARRNFIREQLVAQLVDQHVATLASANPVDVVSTDQHTVKPWFNGKVPFSVDVPQLAGTPFSLVGGRLAYFQQAPAAQLVFAIRQHRISVFIFRDHGETAALGSDSAPARRAGFNTQTWSQDGIRYFAISDVNPADIAHLCALLKQASGS
jgi:anti-sigma factor RsiW